jgi:kinesin family protein 5
MSYIQIYMELIQDLLRPESDNLVKGCHAIQAIPNWTCLPPDVELQPMCLQVIREDVNNGVFVNGVHEVPVATLQECLHYLELGERNR